MNQAQNSAELIVIERIEGLPFERHYSPAEVAALWNLSEDKVRQLFEREPGVLLFETEGPRYGKRRYRTLRIPGSVLERVHRRLSIGKILPLTRPQK